MMMFAIREQIQGGHLLKAVFDSKEAVSDKPAGATQHSDQSFLAVQDSSISDIVGRSVCRSVCLSQLTIRA